MIHALPIKNISDIRELKECSSYTIPNVSSSNNKKIYLRRLIGNIVCLSVLKESKESTKYFSFLTLDTDSLTDGENDILSDIEATSHDCRKQIQKKYGIDVLKKMSIFWEIYFFLPYTNVFGSDLVTESYNGIPSFLKYCLSSLENTKDLLKKLLTIDHNLLPSVEKDILLYYKNVF